MTSEVPGGAELAARRARRWTWVRVALGLLGLGAVVFMVDHLGRDAVWASLGPSLRWLPVVAAIEIGRIAAETIATRIALGERAALIPRAALFRAVLVG
ncbi:MAG TPA: hypothetical protein VL400_14950, partial [Polyangiaceae bacterium]|nr:hypothetical protein [Polyangiaceae bacterium]